MSPGSGMAQRGSHHTDTDSEYHSSLGHRNTCRNPAGPEVVNRAKFRYSIYTL